VSPSVFPASRFDGRHADAVPVRLRVEHHDLIVETADGVVLDYEQLGHVVVSEPFDHTPRLIGLPNGITLEVYDGDGGLTGALQQAGVRLPLAVRLQRHWLGVVAILAAFVGLLAVGYVYFHLTRAQRERAPLDDMLESARAQPKAAG